MGEKLDPVENAGPQQTCLHGADNVNRRDVTLCYVLFRPTFMNCPLILQPAVNSSRLSFLTLRG
jgi:hypothetical protein